MYGVDPQFYEVSGQGSFILGGGRVVTVYGHQAIVSRQVNYHLAAEDALGVKCLYYGTRWQRLAI